MLSRGGGVIPQAFGPAAVIRGSTEAASPQACIKKIAKGRKLSGARTAPYKAARPQACPNP